jgi:radical SAM protein with 4Fe4S-binding SPASM domain
VSYANALFPCVEITSNGLLLNRKICTFLKGKITKLIISLEGPNRKSNDYIRGKGSFVKAMRAIKLAKKIGISVGINFTITNKNLTLVPSMIKLHKELNLDFVNFRRFIPVGSGKENTSLILAPREYLKLNLLINKERKSDRRIALAGDPTRILLDKKLRKKAKSAGCMAGIALISINPSGDVTPCGYINYPIGNIKKKSLIEIWNTSKILKKLRERDNLKGRCGKCHNKLICGGCRAAAYAKYKDLFAEDPVCWIK